jgi:hypothetical protein
MRHSDPRSALGIYAHVIGDQQRKCRTKSLCKASELVQLLESRALLENGEITLAESIELAEAEGFENKPRVLK